MCMHPMHVCCKELDKFQETARIFGLGIKIYNTQASFQKFTD